jgi:hypothetical protein
MVGVGWGCLAFLDTTIDVLTVCMLELDFTLILDVFDNTF